MYEFWQHVAETPWWIYLFFVYLIIIGLKARHPRVISQPAIYLGPLIIVSTYILIFQYAAPPNWSQIGKGVAVLPLGIFIGWGQFKLLGVKSLRNKKQLHIPGSMSAFIIIIALFCSKYYFSPGYDIDPAQLQDPKYLNTLTLSCGLITGLLIGRLLYATRCLRTGPYIE
jgi:hypothetical protein